MPSASARPYGFTVDWLLRGNRAVLLLLVLILVIDAMLIVVHLYASTRGIERNIYYIDRERGYGGFVGYGKFAWLVLLVALFAWENRSWRMAMWLPAFGYFFVDDVFELHERQSEMLTQLLGLDAVLGASAAYVGEHVTSGIAGLAILVPVVIGYLGADDRTKWIFRVLAALVAILVVFGVVVDSLHDVVIEEPRAGDWMAFLEECGEMLTSTVLVVFAARLNLSGGLRGFSTTAEHVSPEA